MTNIQVAPIPQVTFKIKNLPLILKTYVVSGGGGSTRPESGQMYPRTK